MWVKGEKPTINAKSTLIVATKNILHQMLCPYRSREELSQNLQVAPLELKGLIAVGVYKQEAPNGAS